MGNLRENKDGVEKNFIHIRINISGSPLECPGLLLFSIESVLSLEEFSDCLQSTSTHYFPNGSLLCAAFRDFSKHWACESEASRYSSYTQGDCDKVWSCKDV